MGLSYDLPKLIQLTETHTESDTYALTVISVTVHY